MSAPVGTTTMNERIVTTNEKTMSYPASMEETSGGSSSLSENKENCDQLSHWVRPHWKKEIIQKVIRSKLKKRRHLVLSKLIDDAYLQSLFPKLLQHFAPQTVQYNGGRAHIEHWKISCYLEVMHHGIPTAEPNVVLLQHFLPLLQVCNSLFLFWYQQQHSCPVARRSHMRARRLMTFITRYTSAPNEQALLKVRFVCCCLILSLCIDDLYF